ncbi:MAG: pilus assembly protein PilY [Burkholderiaceae bacterium]|jgi:type IV pilus assembly protein PilY1|nr:pilus assembly protein PilY [Burkholderiaceae bacterium]
MRQRSAHKIPAWLAALLLTGFWGYGIVAGQGGPPGFKAVDIASIPLYAAPGSDKPALALALSVEYPTAGAQYVAPDYDGAATPYLDASYDPAHEYLGYYHSGMCYTYIDRPFETPAAGLTAADYKRFRISGLAVGRRCSDAFSGNFLNWASSAAIDMFRLALTGGDRIIDEEGLTVLQRAPASGGDPKCMWNSDINPAKRLDIGDGSYSGTIPQAMIRAAGGAPSVWIATFLNRIFFGARRMDTSAAPFNQNAPVGACSQGDAYALAGAISADGFFYARVEVCGDDASGNPVETRDYYTGRPYCVRYPNGHYKPTGVIQQYGDQLRLAAFGYALDSCDDPAGPAACASPGRYGGVLRAPMKYAGQRTYDENGVENTPLAGNPQAEWDAHTGIFAANPDGDTTQTPGISGVINYINKYGRTGPVLGRYKQNDPSSELYYETLRYLQGLPPSAAAVSRLSAAMHDGFPIFADWSGLDPYGGNRSNTASYACVKSNIALIGGVNDHDATSQPAPGDDSRRRTPASADPAGNIPDIAEWNRVVQAFEKGMSVSYVDGQGVARTTGGNPHPNPYVGETSQSSATVPGAPNNPRSIAPLHDILGLAYWAHTHDIRGSAWSGNAPAQRPGLRVTSFLFDVNQLGQQTFAAVRRGWNQFYMAAKYGGFRSQPTGDAGAPYNTWGNPFLDQDGAPNSGVWQDPARAGEPRNYVMTSDARSVLAAFDAIFSRAVWAQRGIAGAASVSGNITQGGALLYQASFDTGRWSGDVQAYVLRADAASPDQIAVGQAPVWSAARQLGRRTLARNIVIGKSSTGGQPSPAATEFTASAIETGLQNSLNSFPGQTADGRWQDRVDYLRGDNAHEGVLFRRRYGLLGDVAHSGVAYVGAPAPDAASGHAGFAAAHAGRAPAVYVGANDGMMHAFDAATGDELFAYIPSWLGPRLSALTDPRYGSAAVAHRAYADATPVIGDARFGESEGDWKTVLVAGTGAGGRGVFALDVTDPENFSPSKALWEFTQYDDPDMGFVLGKARIVQMRMNDPNAATPVYRWFALVPAGVNSYVPGESGIFSRTGAPAIFLLALDKPAGQTWVQGGNYYKISLPLDAALAATVAPGIVSLEAFTNASGAVTYVFAGDLHGKFWALDFTRFGASNWTDAKLSKFTSGTAYPMYIARDRAGAIQPITAAPVILQGTDASTHYVGFGTGKYLEPADSGATQTQTFYVLYDNGSGAATSGTPGMAGIAGRGRLAPASVDGAGNLALPENFAWGTARPKTDGDMTQRAGWYYDLPASGERVVHDAAWVALTYKAAFSSLIPAASSEPWLCAPGGGSGTSYYVDFMTGTGLIQNSRVGIMGAPMIAFNDAQTVTSAPDSTARALRTRPTVLIQQGAQGIGARQIAAESFPVGRLSWRQINNYLELKNR